MHSEQAYMDMLSSSGVARTFQRREGVVPLPP